MIGGGFKFGLLVGALCVWSLQMVFVNCDLFDFTTDLSNGFISNSSHFNAKLAEKPVSSFHRCMLLCKTMRGCATLNYERSLKTCALYSSITTVTYDSTPGDWVYAELGSIGFPSVPTMCDTSTCALGQICKTVSAGLLCMNVESS